MAKSDRFQIVQKQGNGLSSHQCMVVLDTVTGVQYLYIQAGYSGGLSPLLDKDGKPLAWDT